MYTAEYGHVEAGKVKEKAAKKGKGKEAGRRRRVCMLDDQERGMKVRSKRNSAITTRKKISSLLTPVNSHACCVTDHTTLGQKFERYVCIMRATVDKYVGGPDANHSRGHYSGRKWN